MRVLLIGGCGSIGRRYQAILKRMGADYMVQDPEMGAEYRQYEPHEYDMAIIATPTSTHHALCRQMLTAGKPFLCEKPLSKDLAQCKDLVARSNRMNVPGWVVCNYKFVTGKYVFKEPSIIYDYYNTGTDGLLWDTCQLIYLDPKAVIRNTSTSCHLQVNYKWVPYKEIEQSYVTMIRKFIEDNRGTLWTLRDGMEMTKTVLERIEKDESTTD